MRRLLAAIAFLTRIPIRAEPPLDGRDVGRATPFFPLVGALVGACQAGVILLIATGLAMFELALPDVVAALLAVGTLLLLTGALHQDALADMADGFGGGHTREDVLRIMRDHVIGAYGAVALIVGLGLRIAALTYLIASGQAVAWLIAAGALSRWASTMLGAVLPYARTGGGMGSAVTDHVGAAELVGASVCAIGLSVYFVGVSHAIIAAILAAVIAVEIARRCAKRIGGVTGDTLGATTEIAEVMVLVLGACVTA